MASTVGLARIAPTELTADPFFRHSAGVWLRNMAMLVVLSSAYSLAISRLLRPHEPAVLRKRAAR
jgi:hypothetical protein